MGTTQDVPIGDIRLHLAEHVDGGLVDFQEDAVEDLQTQVRRALLTLLQRSECLHRLFVLTH